MEEELTPERRIRILEVGQRQLVDQMADITVQQADMVERLEQAVERALTNAIDKAVERLQARAAERTGRWFWGTIKSVFTKWLVISGVVLVIGKFAGWQVASTIFDAIMKKGSE